MNESTALPGIHFLTGFVGAPVTITLSREAGGAPGIRLLGNIVAVDETEITVDCVEPLPALTEPLNATIHVLKQGQFFLCHSRTIPELSPIPFRLRLEPPVDFRAVQERHYPRVDTYVPVRLWFPEASMVQEVLMINVSAGGAAVEGPKGLPLGKEVFLVFDLGSGLYFQEMRATLLRGAPTESAAWVYGLQFEQMAEGQRQMLVRWVESTIRRRSGS